MKPEFETCSHCQFFSSPGECRKNAPQSGTGFPTVPPDAWCGEFTDLPPVEQIIQLLPPLTDWCAVFREPDGEFSAVDVVAFGLLADGSLRGLTRYNFEDGFVESDIAGLRGYARRADLERAGVEISTLKIG